MEGSVLGKFISWLWGQVVRYTFFCYTIIRKALQDVLGRFLGPEVGERILQEDTNFLSACELAVFMIFGLVPIVLAVSLLRRELRIRLRLDPYVNYLRYDAAFEDAANRTPSALIRNITHGYPQPEIRGERVKRACRKALTVLAAAVWAFMTIWLVDSIRRAAPFRVSYTASGIPYPPAGTILDMVLSSIVCAVVVIGVPLLICWAVLFVKAAVPRAIQSLRARLGRGGSPLHRPRIRRTRRVGHDQ